MVKRIGGRLQVEKLETIRDFFVYFDLYVNFFEFIQSSKKQTIFHFRIYQGISYLSLSIHDARKSQFYYYMVTECRKDFLHIQSSALNISMKYFLRNGFKLVFITHSPISTSKRCVRNDFSALRLQ